MRQRQQERGGEKTEAGMRSRIPSLAKEATGQTFPAIYLPHQRHAHCKQNRSVRVKDRLQLADDVIESCAH